MRVTPARRTPTLTLGIATALLVAACSGRGADVPPLASPSAGTPFAVGSVAPSAAASPATAAPSAPPAATPAPSPTKAPGTGKIVDKADGFAITLAAGWREIPLDGSETADVEAMLPADSQLGATLEATTSSAAAKGMALFAMDLSADTLAAKVFSGLEVQVAASQNVPLSLLEPLVIGLLDQAPGVTSVSGKIVSLPAGQAIRIIYTLTTKTSTGQTVKLAGTDYVLQTSKHLYTVTFLVSSAAASDGRADATAIMKTFDIL